MNLSQGVDFVKKSLKLNPVAFFVLARKRLMYYWQRLVKPQRKVSYGSENIDKTFYVIGLDHPPMTGLTWIIFLVFLHIIYARKHKYIPIVDMQNFKNKFLEEKLLYKENAWEYFFKQPWGYTLKDIAKSKNIILSSPCSFGPGIESIGPYILSKPWRQKLLYFRKLFHEYIKPAPKAQKYFDQEYNTFIKGRKKVLGVLCRGTDRLLSKPSGHRIQPLPKIVLAKAQEVMRRQKCSHIYLATEDQDIYELFRREFGRKLIVNEQKRLSQNKIPKGKLIHQFDTMSTKERYDMNLAYLSSLYILSKCPCFIGGCTGGTIAIHLMTKGFEYEYTWDLGVYS